MKKDKIWIKWIDSALKSGWTFDVDNTSYICETLGFFVKEDKKNITVALSRSNNDDSLCMLMTIPKCAIKKRRWVKL